MEPKLLSHVTSVNVHVDPNDPTVLEIDVTGEAPGPGYTDNLLEPLEYTSPPENGIFEFLLTGMPPEEDIQEEPNSVVANTFHWKGFPEGLRGVVVIAYENSLAAALRPEDLLPESAGNLDEENY